MPGTIVKDLSVEASLLTFSAFPSQSSHAGSHPPKFEAPQHKALTIQRGDRELVIEATAVDASMGEGRGSGTSKTGHSTRTKRKHKRATHKRQHGELTSVSEQIA